MSEGLFSHDTGHMVTSYVFISLISTEWPIVIHLPIYHSLFAVDCKIWKAFTISLTHCSLWYKMAVIKNPSSPTWKSLILPISFKTVLYKGQTSYNQDQDPLMWALILILAPACLQLYKILKDQYPNLNGLINS